MDAYPLYLTRILFFLPAHKYNITLMECFIFFPSWTLLFSNQIMVYIEYTLLVNYQNLS